MLEIKRIEFEISSLCNAKCPDCARTRNIERNEPFFLGVLPFKDIQKWFQDVDLSKAKIKLCGILGDPLTHPHLYEIVDFFLNDRECWYLEISTNGGLKNSNYWQKLGKLSANSKKRFWVHWSIDGVYTNYYRENVDLAKVWQNVDAYNSAGGLSEWQFIQFDYNFHEIELAQELAAQKNMKFSLRKSWRNTNPESKFQDKRSVDIFDDYVNFDTKQQSADDIFCKHYDESEIYVAVDKTVWPCCYLFDEKIKNKNPQISQLFDKYPNFNNLSYFSLPEILSHEWFDNVLKRSWDPNHPLHISRCPRTCGHKGKNREKKGTDVAK